MSALSNEQQGENGSYLLERIDSKLTNYDYEAKIQSEFILNLQSTCRGYLARKSFKNLFE